MNMTAFEEFAELMKQLARILEELTDVEREKMRAVRQDDLNALSECMKKEQAMTLALRGLDTKRETLLASAGLARVPLNALCEKVPEGERLRVKKMAEDLKRQYEIFRGTADAAQDILEINLHQVEKFLTKIDEDRAGADRNELPDRMRTDFKV